MNATYGERTVTLTRVFDAPRELVWRAWTEPAQLAQWFGPRGFLQLGARTGCARRRGLAHRHARARRQRLSDEGRVPRGRCRRRAWCSATIALDNDGNHLLEGETTVILEEQGGKTKLTLHSFAKGMVPTAPQMLAGMEAGWSQSLDKLGELVAKVD